MSKADDPVDSCLPDPVNHDCGRVGGGDERYASRHLCRPETDLLAQTR